MTLLAIKPESASALIDACEVLPWVHGRICELTGDSPKPCFCVEGAILNTFITLNPSIAPNAKWVPRYASLRHKAERTPLKLVSDATDKFCNLDNSYAPDEAFNFFFDVTYEHDDRNIDPKYFPFIADIDATSVVPRLCRLNDRGESRDPLTLDNMRANPDSFTLMGLNDQYRWQLKDFARLFRLMLQL